MGAPNEIKKNWDLNASARGPFQARQGLVLVLDALHRRRELGAGLRERERLQPIGVLVRAGHNTRAPRGAFLQQQSSHHVAGDATQQDRRNVQTGHMVRLSERDYRGRGSRGRPRLPLPAVAADTWGVDLAGDQSDAVRGCGHAPLRAMGIHASASPYGLVSRVRIDRAPDDFRYRAINGARLSGAGGQQQQHARAELHLPGGDGVCHRVAQLQGGLQPGARFPGDDQLQLERAGLPVQLRRPESAHDAGKPGEVPKPSRQRPRTLCSGQMGAQEHDPEPGAAVRPLQRELSRADRRPRRAWRRRGTSFFRLRTT